MTSRERTTGPAEGSRRGGETENGRHSGAQPTAASGAALASESEPRPGDPAEVVRQQRLLTAALRLLQLGPVLVLGVLVVVTATTTPIFLNEENLRNLGVQTSYIAILAMGQLLVILTRGIDLSVGSVLSLCTVVGALAFESGTRGGLVILLMLAVGLAAGLVNGLVLVKLRIPHPFIVTLGTLNIAGGLALLLSDGLIITGVPPVVSDIGGGTTLGIQTPILITAVLAVVTVVFTTRVRWGRWIYAVGGSPEAATRAGLPVDRLIISVYVLSGLAAAVAALIIAGRTGVGDPVAGRMLELDAIAAAIIGGASFFGGRGTVIGVLAGALVIGVIRNSLNLQSVSPHLQVLVIGVVVIVAVGLDVLRAKLETRFQRLHAEREA
jgi:ribose transport system permease protein